MTGGPAPVGALAAVLVGAVVVAARAAWANTRRAAVARRLGPDRTAERRGRDGAPLSSSRPRARPALPEAPRWLAAALADAGIDIDAPVAWSGWIGGSAIVTLGALAVGGPAAAVLAAAAASGAPLVALRARRGRGDAKLEATLPVALEAVARGLRSGASLRQAVREAAASTPGTLGAELSRVAGEVDNGLPLVAALERLADRRPLRSLRLGVAALCLGAETGGAQARAVDGVAATVRDRLAVAAEVRALSAQARMSALVIGVAPVGFGGFAAATDPRTSRFLFHTTLGLGLLAAGLVLDGLGWLWMQRLCRVGA